MTDPVNPPPGTDPTANPHGPPPDPGQPAEILPMLRPDGIPRRADMTLWIPAEKSIYDLMQEVEALGAHVRLTDAVILLGQARDAVADWAEMTGNVKPSA